VIPFEFCRDLQQQKTKSPWALFVWSNV